MRLTPSSLCTLAACLLASAVARGQEYPAPPPLPPPPPPVPSAPLPGYLPAPGERMPVVSAPLAAQVTVHFAPKSSGDEYFVAVGDGAEPVKAPCDLQLYPGKLKLEVSGAGSFSQRLTVPAVAASTVTIEHRSKGLMGLGIGGIALLGLGFVMLETALEPLLSGYLAAAWSNTSFDAKTVTNQEVVPGVSFQNWMIVGGVAAGVGVVCAAVGLAKMGHNRVVLTADNRVGDSSEAPALELVGVGLAPTAGGAAAGATFAF